MSRFSMLGRMICGIFSEVSGPKAVVCIGDLFDLPSLSSHDRPGSRSFEGKRWKDDLEAGREAQSLIFAEVDAYNRPRRGDAKLEIDWHYTHGNHEARVTRCVESDPAKLEGVLSLEQLTDGFPWKVYPFLEPFFLGGGVGFSHYWASGVMGRGASSAAALLRKQQISVVQGHSHLLDYAENTSADGRRLSGLICGCYFTHSNGMEWAGPQVRQMWRPGIAVLRGVQFGEFDLEWWSFRRVQEQFGS